MTPCIERSLRSQALDLLRFPLAIIIVTDHVFSLVKIPFKGEIFDVSNFDVLVGIGAFIRSFFFGIGVPVYFFIAGYVFFLGIELNKSTYIRKMRNRFKSLFIPYIVWNIVGIIGALIPFLPILHSIYPTYSISDVNITLKSILSCFWNYDGSLVNREVMFGNPINIPLWFVRDLMIIALSTPIINFVFKRYGALLPFISGIIWFSIPNMYTGHSYQLLTALFFFSFGGYMSYSKKDMVLEFKKYQKLCYVLFPLSSLILLGYTYQFSTPAHVMEGGFHGPILYVKHVATLSGLFFVYNLAVWLVDVRGWRSNKTLTNASFFIYAGHIIMIVVISKLIMLIVPPMNDFLAVMFYILTDIFVCTSLLGIYVIMRRFTPSFLQVFTGGRS